MPRTVSSSDRPQTSGEGKAWTGVFSILTNGSSLAVVNVLTVIVRLGVVIMLARALGPELYGDYAYGFGLTMVAMGAAMFGTNGLIIRDIAREDGEHLPKNLEPALALRTVTSGFAALAPLAVLAVIGASASVWALTSIFALGLVFRSLSELFHGVLTGRERGTLAAQLSLVRLFCEMAGVGALVFIGAPVWAFATLYAACWALQLILLRRAAGYVFPRRPSLIALSWPLVRAGAPLGLTASAGVWLVQSPLIAAQGAGLAPHQVGLIALAVQLIAVSRLVPGAFVMAALPLLARAQDRGDGKDQAFFQLQFIVTWALGGLAVLLSGPALQLVAPLIFGGRYGDLAELATPMAVTLLFWMLLMGFETAALVQNRTMEFCAVLVGAGLLVAALIIQSPETGLGLPYLWAAATACAAATVTALLLSIRAGRSRIEDIAVHLFASTGLFALVQAAEVGLSPSLAALAFILVLGAVSVFSLQRRTQHSAASQ